MQGFTILGKALLLSFWLLLAAALGGWLASPFAQLVYLLGAFTLLLHGVQLWLFAAPLAERPNPWLGRVQVLLFGIFHVLSQRTVPARQAAAREVAHA